MKRLFALAAAAFVLTVGSLFLSGTADAAQSGNPHVLVFDVAQDFRTFSVSHGRTLAEALRGDAFIVNGKIYPGYTIPAGGTMQNPSSFGPDMPGSIGEWVCRGVFYNSLADILRGAEPHVYSTQYHEIRGRGTILSDGPEGGQQIRALTGGTIDFRGIEGEMTETPIGTNPTGGFNLRFTIRLHNAATLNR